jgi:leucyl aminopeptidase
MISYKISHTIDKNVDCFIFLFCDKYEDEIKRVEKQMSIKFPESFLKDINKNKLDIKTMYLDKYSIILAGMNFNKGCTFEKYSESSSLCARYILNHKFQNIALLCNSTNIDIVRLIIENFILGIYEYNTYKKNGENKQNNLIKNINFILPKSNKLINIKNSLIISENINFARDLINTPANDCNSEWFLKQMKKNAPKSLKFKIYNKNNLIKMGMNLILSVNQGSKNPVYLVEIHYGNTSNNPIVLIGKGVTFDSGGYNLKHADFSDMKTDMGGAAIIYETMCTLAKTNAKGNFIALLPLVENMINEHATRPGDIITSYDKNITVEINDTDAEGRLIIADSLLFSKKFNPKLIIDVATLTGSASYMLGDQGSILMSNNDKYLKKIMNISEKTNEKIWQMPLWNNFIEMTKSNIATFRNVSHEAKAGAIMAGAFLYNFVPKNVDWIHLDIAGVTYLSHNSKYRTSGATGESLRFLYYFLINL